MIEIDMNRIFKTEKIQKIWITPIQDKDKKEDIILYNEKEDKE